MTDLTSVRLDRTRWLVGILAGALLLWAVVLYSVRDVGATFSTLGETAISLLAAVSRALAAARSSGRLRLAWGALGTAALAWAAGQAGEVSVIVTSTPPSRATRTS